MAIANGFLIIRLLMDASFHAPFSAISLVPACIFCSMELYLCDFPMGYSRVWFLMVRTDNNNIFQLFLRFEFIILSSFLPGGHILSLSWALPGLLCGKPPCLFRLIYKFIGKKEFNRKALFVVQVFLLGPGSHTVLWDIRTDNKSQIYNSPQIVSPWLRLAILVSYPLIENFVSILDSSFDFWWFNLFAKREGNAQVYPSLQFYDWFANPLSCLFWSWNSNQCQKPASSLFLVLLTFSIMNYWLVFALECG